MQYSFKQYLAEAEMETKIIGDLWDEIGSDAKQYTQAAVYSAKPGEKKDTMDVYLEQNGRRQKFATMSDSDFKDSFEAVRPNETPDAEGYKTYRSADVIDAVEYKGDPIIVDIDGVTSKVKSGDYITRTTSGRDIVLSVETSAFFAQSYSKV